MQELLALAMLGVCSVEDLKYRQIRVKWIVFFAAVGILCRVCLWKQPVLELFTAIVPGFLLLLLAFFARGGIGEGDGLLLMAFGIFLGAACTLRIFLYAAVLSAGCALFLYLVKKKSRKYEMPFVPFLFLSFVGELLFKR